MITYYFCSNVTQRDVPASGKNMRFRLTHIFLFGYYWRYSLTEVDKKFELKLSKSQICLYCKIKSKENRFRRKKVKKKAYSITT